ncbi:hypothetical protein PHSY_004042 [Pseudozyma hubeiensis SY62]|uniref:Uncharacterized protein n=1 Tax=Pseudozyma hubeiensis (strain SY62) TaxID=1305764 RepID=R9P5F6_PSEHS|nr:hypothetical protein PHSY_004042 [Pseudozyma hubeiensis SY62]GAC96462.1 hypothetical protein PHSY_004042 [Pseudozyma hubeiensis SY62]
MPSERIVRSVDDDGLANYRTSVVYCKWDRHDRAERSQSSDIDGAASLNEGEWYRLAKSSSSSSSSSSRAPGSSRNEGQPGKSTSTLFGEEGPKAVRCLGGSSSVPFRAVISVGLSHALAITARSNWSMQLISNAVHSLDSRSAVECGPSCSGGSHVPRDGAATF